jgi:hypothetical protein
LHFSRLEEAFVIVVFVVLDLFDHSLRPGFLWFMDLNVRIVFFFLRGDFLVSSRVLLKEIRVARSFKH